MIDPGPELDALVAEKVMGWKYEQRPYSNAEGMGWASDPPDDYGYFGEDKVAPAYSTDIRAAWEVVEKILGAPFRGDVYFYRRPSEESWVVQLLDDNGTVFAAGDGQSAPRAICLAALKAVGVEI